MKKIILSLVSFLGLSSVVQAAVDLGTFKRLAGSDLRDAISAGTEILNSKPSANDQKIAECFPAYKAAQDDAAAKAAREAAAKEAAAAKAAQDKAAREAAEQKAREDRERADRDLAAGQKAAEEAKAQEALEAQAITQAAIEAAAVEIAAAQAAEGTSKIEEAKSDLIALGASSAALKAFEDSVERVVNDPIDESAALKYAKAMMEATHRPLKGLDGKDLKSSEEANARAKAIEQIKKTSGYYDLSPKEQKEFDDAFNQLNKDSQTRSWYKSKKAIAAITLAALVVLASIAAYYKGLITKDMSDKIYEAAKKNLSSARDALGGYYNSALKALKDASGSINTNAKSLYTKAIESSKNAYQALGTTSANVGSSLWEGTKSAWTATTGLVRSAATTISNVALLSSAVASAKAYFLGSAAVPAAAEEDSQAAKAAVEAAAAAELAQKNAARNQAALNKGPGMKVPLAPEPKKEMTAAEIFQESLKERRK